jgi:hypothetical protein
MDHSPLTSSRQAIDASQRARIIQGVPANTPMGDLDAALYGQLSPFLAPEASAALPAAPEHNPVALSSLAPGVEIPLARVAELLAEAVAVVANGYVLFPGGTTLTGDPENTFLDLHCVDDDGATDLCFLEQDNQSVPALGDGRLLLRDIDGDEVEVTLLGHLEWEPYPGDSIPKPTAETSATSPAGPMVAQAPAELAATMLPPIPVLTKEEKDRRAGFFAHDLADALLKFDDVTRDAGAMKLVCTFQFATMNGGIGGGNVLHRTTETSTEWIQRITTHWAGYLENNGVAMMSVPLEPGEPSERPLAPPEVLKYRELRVSSRVTLALDPADSATPAMVLGEPSIGRDGRAHGKFSASFDGAMNSGLLSGSADEMELNRAELDVLDRYSDLVDTFHEEARKGCPEYE